MLKSRFALVPGPVSLLHPAVMLSGDKRSSNILEVEFERAPRKNKYECDSKAEKRLLNTVEKKNGVIRQH